MARKRTQPLSCHAAMHVHIPGEFLCCQHSPWRAAGPRLRARRGRFHATAPPGGALRVHVALARQAFTNESRDDRRFQCCTVTRARSHVCRGPVDRRARSSPTGRPPGLAPLQQISWSPRRRASARPCRIGVNLARCDVPSRGRSTCRFSGGASIAWCSPRAREARGAHRTLVKRAVVTACFTNEECCCVFCLMVYHHVVQWRSTNRTIGGLQ